MYLQNILNPEFSSSIKKCLFMGLIDSPNQFHKAGQLIKQWTKFRHNLEKKLVEVRKRHLRISYTFSYGPTTKLSLPPSAQKG